MAAESVWFQIMREMKRRIVALNLPMIREDQVFVRKLPFNRNAAFPGITLFPEVETTKFATNASDDIGYGVQVVMVQASNQDMESNLDRMLIWRERIRQELSGDRLSNVDGADVWNVEVTPGAVFLPEAFVKGLDVSALMCRVTSREQVRG